MSRSPDGPDRYSSSDAGHGFLTPAIRRDVADVNRRFLDLALEPALAGDPRFSLPDDVVPVLSAGGDALLSRVAMPRSGSRSSLRRACPRGRSTFPTRR